MAKNIHFIENGNDIIAASSDVLKSKDFESDIYEVFRNSAEYQNISHDYYRERWMSARDLLLNLPIQEKIAFNQIIKNEIGKPQLANSKYYTSLSHSNKKVAAILSLNKCGIDIEDFREKILRINKKFMADSEFDQFGSNDLETSTLLWSAKESIYKMLGIPGLIFKEDMICEKIDFEKGQMHFQLAEICNANSANVRFKLFDDHLLSYVVSG